ncbi:MAG: cytochrome c oxidase subunit II [Hyphomicrobiaceae bacterium]
MMRWLRNAVASVGLSAAMALAFGLAPVFAGVGQPTPGEINLQGSVTDIGDQIHHFHNYVNTIIIAIAVFVLILLAFVIFKFNETSNPVPSKTTHNTGLEVAWTIIPVLILVAIAIPSFKLLYAEYTYPNPDVTLKATGNQWNWTYQYPDQGGFSFTSIMLNDQERDERIKRGIPSPRLLAVDNEVVVPVNKVVLVLITASDVIHSWTVPSFGSKQDAVPGRTTSTFFKAREEGVYYGQCSELCGKDHAFMPIAVRVVKQEVFDQWAAAMKARKRKEAREIIEKAALEQAAAAKKVADGLSDGQKVAAAAR